MNPKTVKQCRERVQCGRFSTLNAIVKEIRKPLAVVTVTFSPGRYLGAFLTSLRAATERDTCCLLYTSDAADE